MQILITLFKKVRLSGRSIREKDRCPMVQMVRKRKRDKCPMVQTGLPDFSWSKHTKKGKVQQRGTNYTKRPYIKPIGHKIYQIAVKYANILHSKTLQHIPKLEFLVLK
jgi:hypothetical protein